MQDEKRIRADIEVLRIIASLGIVFYHSGVECGYFGLVSFLIISTFFSGNGNDLFSSIKKRFGRIMVPWIFWSLIYGAENVVKHEQFIDTSRGIVAGVLASPSIHLWYLPYAFFVLVVTDLVKLRVPVVSFSLVCGFASSMMLFLTHFWRPSSIAEGYPWAQYIHGLAAIFFGLFLANYARMNKVVLILLVVLNVVSTVFYLETKNCGIEYTVAYSVLSLIVLFGGSIKLARTSILFGVSQCSFGVYLVHMLVFSVLAKVFHSSDSLWFPSISFVFSLLLVWIARRIAPKITERIF